MTRTLKRCIIALLAALILSAAIMPSYALYIRETRDYDTQRLREFLEITDINGVKNGDKVNPHGYDPDDAATWTGVDWDGSSVTGIMWMGLELEGVMDLSGCDRLTVLFCSDNSLTGLNLGGCSALAIAECARNSLSMINLGGGVSLKRLDCGGNSLTSLDLDDCIALEQLFCTENYLQRIDLSNNTSLTELRTSGNPIENIEVNAPSLGAGQVLISSGRGGAAYLERYSYWNDAGEQEMTELTASAVPMEGYVFDGWYDQLGVCFSASYSVTLTGGDYSLTAAYSQAGDIIGSLEIAPATALAGGEASIPLNAYGVSDMTFTLLYDGGVLNFLSWSAREPDGIAVNNCGPGELSVSVSGQSENINGEFARLVFSVNESARGLSRLEVSSFEGCSFINGVPASLLPEQVILTNGTLVIVPVYTVTFIDGLTGERIMDQEVPEGSGAQAPEPPDHEGYEFTGWHGDFSEVYRDTVIIARYERLGLDETGRIRAFLEHADETGVSNGLKLNPDYDPYDISTWTGITWNGSRAERIEWTGFGLCGNLDLSGFSELLYLSLDGNLLETLNLNGCSRLRELICEKNRLEGADLLGCTALEDLNVSYNALNILNLDTNPELRSLNCANNAISELSLLDKPMLSALDFTNNMLTSIDLSQNPNLSLLRSGGNPLVSISTDSEALGANPVSVAAPDGGIVELNTMGEAGLGLTAKAYRTYGMFDGWYGGEGERLSGDTEFDIQGPCDINARFFEYAGMLEASGGAVMPGGDANIRIFARGLCGADFTLEYDPDVLEYIGCTPLVEGALPRVVQHAPGRLDVEFEGICDNVETALADFRFSTPAQAEGSHIVSVNPRGGNALGFWGSFEIDPSDIVCGDGQLIFDEAYVVTFVDGVTGETLDEQVVPAGMPALAPQPPDHYGRMFIGWDKDISAVLCDMIVTARYGLIGDMDMNGVVSITDAVMISRHCVRLEMFSELQLMLADADGNGRVNNTDAVKLIRYILGLEPL